MTVSLAIDVSVPAASFPGQGAILHALPDPIIAVDAENRLRFVNAAAEDFFQLSSATLLRYRLGDLVPDSSPFSEAVAQVRGSGSVITKYAVNVGTPRTGGTR